jgi:hypothetical protein
MKFYIAVVNYLPPSNTKVNTDFSRSHGFTSMIMRQCLSGTVAANGSIVRSPDDTRMNMKQWWNDIDRGKLKTLRKTCPCATLSPQIPLD